MKKMFWNKAFVGSGAIIGMVFGCSQYLLNDKGGSKETSTTQLQKQIPLKGIIVPVNIDSIYDFLKTNYPTYDGITYSQPTTNVLRANNWLLQTPDIWGFDINAYNNVFQNNLDACYNLPTCTVTTDCQGGDPSFPAECVAPNFTTAETVGCPNSASTPAGQKLCLSNAHKILTNLYNDIVNAQHTIDISMLNTGANFLTEQQFGADNSGNIVAQQTPDAYFFVLKQALTELSSTGRSVTVRLLGGTYNGAVNTLTNAQDFLKVLIADFSSNNNLSIVVVPERSCPTLTFYGPSCDNPFASSNDMFKGSWNHGKNIIIDQTIAYTGGENLWGGDYLTSNPTNDDYFRIEGPVAQAGTAFNNQMFSYLSTLYGFENKYSDQCMVYQNKTISVQESCNADWAKSPTLTVSVTPNPGDISATSMYIGKLNGGIVADNGNKNADESEPARVFAISNATQSVKIAQQSLFIKGWTVNPSTEQPSLDGTIWPANPGSITTPNPIATMEAIATVFKNNIEFGTSIPVYILTTAYSENDGYGADVDLAYIYKFLCRELITTFKKSASVAQSQLSQNLHLGYVSYNNEPASGGVPGHHNKFWMVDDHLFYFGSHNFYPSSLQQFGIITDSSAAAAEVNSQFWDKLWSNADTSTDAFDPSQANCNNLNG